MTKVTMHIDNNLRMPTVTLVMVLLLISSAIVARSEETALTSLSLQFPGDQNVRDSNVVHLRIGTSTLTVEIARTPRQMAVGLAFRPSLAPDKGMLFIHKAPQRVVYNALDTLFPLSCAYIDAAGFVLEINDLSAKDKIQITSKTDQIKFVVEANRGWFEQHKITPGVRIMITD
jgi:uncharacterized membrane protein (UPF0127 family)